MKKMSLMCAGSIISLALSAASPSYAQSSDNAAMPDQNEEAPPATEEEEPPATEEEAPAATEEEAPAATEEVAPTAANTENSYGAGIVVTGSRLKQNTFSSISPLQVIQNENAEDTGEFEAAALLQRSEAASGQQIDGTFQGFVLNNGPGSQTLSLRGLGADRTLLMINGRRMAPAGVEGAPTNPSLNLIPSSLVDRYDLLLDGASSVYGSDAVAGVVNVILRKNFDGLTFRANGNINPQGAGEDYTISASWGVNNDSGFLGLGAEYASTAVIRLKDRKFFRGCDKHYEVDQYGNTRTLGIADNAVINARSPGIGTSVNECKITGISGRIFNEFTNYGSIYYTPGPGNTGIPYYNENSYPGIGDIDSDGDGKVDVDFQDVNTNGSNREQVFQNGRRLLNLMALGEYTFEGDANITPFFELTYSRQEAYADNTGAPQLFPTVPANNPFNPCNRLAVGGVDCRLAERVTYGYPISVGFDLPVQPIVAVKGDRNNFSTVQEQYRGVLGVKGDLPFIGSGWDFEVSGVYSKAIGKSLRKGIREDKLAFALGLDPTADYNGDGVFDNNGDGVADDYDQNVEAGLGFWGGPLLAAPCSAAGLRNPGAAMPDLTAGCVPVNMFAPSLLGSPIGDFATQAERDYLFGVREFDTTYEQLVLSGFVSGSLFSLPGGVASVGVGAEYRKDKINSTPSVVAANGLFFGFFADRGAVGSKDIKEAFGEVNMPLVAGETLARELTLNVSGRYTDEQYYGSAGTYSIKGKWRPFDPIAFKFSYGTSFRAPNLRENFLAGQTGFSTLFDPCAVTDASLVTGAYNPSLDDREETTLANCKREGRDPTKVGLNPALASTNALTSVEILSGGSLDIDEETSRALTAGVAFEETFGGGFRVGLGASYFNIRVKGSIVEPSSQFILNDCYTRQDGKRSPFCDRITASTLEADRFLVKKVSSGFINLNSEDVRGIDFNADFGKEVQLFGTNVDLGINVRANHLLEISTTFIDDNGVSSYDDDRGEFGYPKWTGQASFTAGIQKFRFTWQVQYTGPVEQQSDGIDPLSSAFGRNAENVATGFIGDTCLGNGSGAVAGDWIFCRDVGFAKKYFEHTASVRYTDRPSGLVLRAGVSNIFNRNPPLVYGSEVFAIANTAIGNGYNYNGREFFFAIEKKF